MVDSHGKTFGFMEVNAQAVFRLVQVKASKRLGSDQLESDNSSLTLNAMSLTNIECKHEQDINHHEHEHHRGYVDFVSTTCMNMRQVKPLETFKGEYHLIILHHSHLKIYVGNQDKPL